MDMQMCHGLTRGRALIDSEVVAIRVMRIFENRPGIIQGLEQGELLGPGRVKQGGYVPFRDDYRMTERKREAILVDHGEFVLGQDAVGVEMAKGTGFDIGLVHAGI